MGRTALLIRVPEAEEATRPVREAHVEVTKLGIPAHITLIVPFLPPEQLTPEVHDALVEIFAAAAPFRFSLERLDHFPGVTWLAPDPAAPFLALVDALVARFPDAPPYGGLHAEVIPHLTLAMTDAPEVVDDVKSSLRGQLPLASMATDVWLYVEDGDCQWHARDRFALGR
jgi:2'-5' RNA ligase